MKLSVLIPTYDYKCFTLVADLQRQLAATMKPYEIIVADDGSHDRVSVIANLRINELPCCRYIRREENVGRAAIRNFLAGEAKGEWLLFLDNDAGVDSPLFIMHLFEAIDHADGAQVIVGGLHHAAHLPRPEVSLRYRYEKAADRHRSAEERGRHPYAQFTPFNMCIRHDTMLAILFDETCRDYGYEDALFGVTLQQKGVKIKHIDNPLLHRGLETNAIFLHKTETAIRTLNTLGNRMMPHTAVGRMAISLRKYHVASLVALTFRIARPMMKHNLLGASPNLTIFSLYKLGLLCTM